jgi:RecA/RadA recombinase
VVDSVAGLFRADYEPSDAINRAKDLQTVGGQLHKLAAKFRMAVICVNQVPAVHAHVYVLSEWRIDSTFKQKYPSVQMHSCSNTRYRNIG